MIKGGEAMFGKLARGTALLFLGTMIAVWALSVGKKETTARPAGPQIEYLYV
jgi:hypothetical protein